MKQWFDLIALLLSGGMMIVGVISLYLSFKSDKRDDVEDKAELTKTIGELKSSILLLNAVINDIKGMLVDKVSKELFQSEINGLKSRVDKLET